MDARKRLFEVPPAEFTRARDALVRELREKGKTDEAKEVAAMRKPAAALWIANQVARLAPDDVKALIHATERLRKGDDLREAMQEQRDALTRLSDAAGRAALEIGTQLSPSLQRRVQSTVQAAATTEPEALREGTLEHELEPVGFEGLAGVPMHEPKHAPPEKDDEEDKENEKELKKAEEVEKRLRAAAEKLERAAQKAEQTAAQARERAKKARGEADEAAARTLALRRG